MKKATKKDWSPEEIITLKETVAGAKDIATGLGIAAKKLNRGLSGVRHQFYETRKKAATKQGPKKKKTAPVIKAPKITAPLISKEKAMVQKLLTGFEVDSFALNGTTLTIELS